jgi:uncharacterized membrane protein
MKKTGIMLFSVILCSFIASAAITSMNVTKVNPSDYSDIWLGVSTGGYKLIAEKGSSFTFELFIKNGMNIRSLHDVKISPSSDFQFNVTDITPKSIDQLKPMEIRFYLVNITIPEDTPEGKYPLLFDVSSAEFPQGVFSLKDEIKIVRRINTELYIAYAVLSVLIIAFLIYRKIRLGKQKYD